VGNYRDLIVWQKALKLALAVYKETAHFPIEEKYGITAQLRRACVSIPSNIAEGEGRRSPSEFRRFLFIALGSLKEVETQILISQALLYLRPNEASKLITMTTEVGRLITGLSKSLSKKRPSTTSSQLLTTN
jgi:four helix bundle protein